MLPGLCHTLLPHVLEMRLGSSRDITCRQLQSRESVNSDPDQAHPPADRRAWLVAHTNLQLKSLEEGRPD